jgi:hypothetical protein
VALSFYAGQVGFVAFDLCQQEHHALVQRAIWPCKLILNPSFRFAIGGHERFTITETLSPNGLFSTSSDLAMEIFVVGYGEYGQVHESLLPRQILLPP